MTHFRKEPPPDRRAQAGFTLFEALVGVALMGLILSLLAVVTAQWVPHWQAGFFRLQRAELVGLGLDRLTSDLASAEFIAPIGGDQPLFYGASSSVTFVRTPLGPRLTASLANDLEIIRYADKPDAGGLLRSRTAFAPQASQAVRTDDFEFSDSNLVIRSPLKISFAFAGPDRVWADEWTGTGLPAAVRISVRNAQSGELLAVSTATPLHINAPAGCVSDTPPAGCPKGNGNSGSRPGGEAAAPQQGRPGL